MPVSDVLKSFRNGHSPDGKKDESPSGPRTFKLTDDEIKELQGYQKSPGMEQECLVTGRLAENGEFSVSSVRSPGGSSDQQDMESAMKGPMGGPPMMQG